MQVALWAAAAFALSVTSVSALEMTNRCYANVWESCYLVVEGPITSDAAEVFAAKSTQMDGNKVVFNSEGGDPVAAITMGRLIRSRGFETETGRWGDGTGPIDGKCSGACVFAFLGGVARSTSPESIAFGGIDPGFGTDQTKERAIIFATQYLIEMGAEADVLLRESEQPFTEDELRSTGIVYAPPAGFGPFEIEPYKDGIVAASKRLDDAGPYSRVRQLTAFCRDGLAHFMMTAGGGFMSDKGFADLRVWTNGANQDSDSAKVEITSVKTWSGETTGFVQFSLEPNIASKIDDISVLDMRYDPGRVAGGVHYFRRDLTDIDRQMLSTAFRFCI